MEYKLTKAKLFLFSCLFFILGVGLGSIFSFSFFMSYIILCLAVVIFILGRGDKRLIILGLGGVFLFLGIIRFNLGLPKIDQENVAFYNGEKEKIIGIVSAEPDTRQDSVKLKIKTEKIFLDQEERKIKGNVLVKTGLFPEYSYGDRLELDCELLRPEKVEDFDYEKYLARYDIYSLCYDPRIRLLEHGQGNIIMSYLLAGKGYFLATINKILPEPQAAFLGGVLIGARRSIPDDLNQAFNRTGTTHIIAISGYNITIIAMVLLALAKGLGISRKRSFWFIVAGISFFVVITGASASVVRAAVMGLIVLLAKQIGRMSRITNALVFTAVIMLFINPKILMFDAGFQLSFLSTMGLVYLSPILEKYFSRWPELYGVKESFTTTLSAIIFTLPLIIFQFGRLSLVAPFVNILILPFIPLSMAIGFLAVVAGMIFWPLGWILGWLVWLVLSYIILVVGTFSNFGWAAIELGSISWWLMGLLYGLIIFWIWREGKKENKK